MVRLEWSRYDAALFDLDGVLTSTAEVHEQAWKRTFDGFLARRGGPDVVPFTTEDYLRHVDGRPRYDGVRSFLGSRGIVLPEGDPADPPGDQTVCSVGNAKNAMFRRVLADQGAKAFPDAVDLLDDLRDRPIRLAVVSSSANATSVLEAAGMAERFELVMDGRLAQDRGLPGKPAPDTFVAAAGELGTVASRAVVLEDAVSGVVAGVAGGFGATVGVDRTGSADLLAAAGATVVVRDLRELIPPA